MSGSGRRGSGRWKARTVGRPLAARLLADGESVLGVPAKLAARVRVFDTGQGRKTDATDAHAVAMVALRTGGLRQLVVDEELTVLGCWLIAATSCPGLGPRRSTGCTGRWPS